MADWRPTFGASPPQPEPLLPSLVYAELAPAVRRARVGYNLPLQIGPTNPVPWLVNYDSQRWFAIHARVAAATPNVVDLFLAPPGFGVAGRFVTYDADPPSLEDSHDRDMPHIYRYPIVIPS